MIAWAAAVREAPLARAVVRQTRSRTANRAGVPWISDGWVAYTEEVDGAYRDSVATDHPGWARLPRTPGVALTQAVKHRRGRRLTAIEVQATIGEVAAQPYDVHVERLNGVLRDRLGCLTRKTHAFAKTATTWDAALALALFEHNWLRPHPALRVPLAAPTGSRRYDQRTPAQAIGLTDHRWSWNEFLTRRVHQLN